MNSPLTRSDVLLSGQKSVATEKTTSSGPDSEVSSGLTLVPNEPGSQ